MKTCILNHSYLNYYFIYDVCACFRLSVFLQKRTSYWLHLSKNVRIKSCHIFKTNENVHFMFCPFYVWILLDQIRPKWIKLDQIGFLTN